MIDDGSVKDLTTHGDKRGFFREIVRVTDGFFAEGLGQWNHALAHAGVAKAWHDPAGELRIPHDDPEIGYDWTRGPTIK